MGQEMQTTFWQDFTIADAFGPSAVEDTFKRAFEEWRTDVVYVTELSLVTNWKIWQHWEKGDQAMAELYDGLWRKVDEWCCANLAGDELRYYYETTD